MLHSKFTWPARAQDVDEMFKVVKTLGNINEFNVEKKYRDSSKCVTQGTYVERLHFFFDVLQAFGFIRRHQSFPLKMFFRVLPMALNCSMLSLTLLISSSGDWLARFLAAAFKMAFLNCSTLTPG